MSISSLTGGCCRVPLHGLADVDGEVAHPFEVAVDLDRGHDHPQVHRHRLVEREQPEAAAVDLDVQLIDRFVAGKDLVSGLDVPFGHGLEGQPETLFGKAAHEEQPCLELFEFFLEVSNDALGGLHRHDRRTPTAVILAQTTRVF